MQSHQAQVQSVSGSTRTHKGLSPSEVKNRLTRYLPAALLPTQNELPGHSRADLMRLMGVSGRTVTKAILEAEKDGEMFHKDYAFRDIAGRKQTSRRYFFKGETIP
jgi:hypothetical protein